MKNLICLAALSLIGHFASASGSTGPNYDLLTGHTWSAFFTLEPLVNDRRLLELSIQNGQPFYKVTCLFSEFGYGENVTLTFQSSPTNINENTFTEANSAQQSVTNSQGHVCAGFITGEVKSYVVFNGGRQIAVNHRVFEIEN